MKYISTTFISVLAIALASTSCVGTSDSPELLEAQPVIVDIPYRMAVPSEMSPTRANSSDEQALHDLQVFVFSPSGALKGYSQVTEGLAQDGSRSTVKVETTTGSAIICAIANASTTIWSVEGMDMSSMTLERLKNLSFSTGVDGVTDPTDGRFLMSGWMDDGRAVEIGPQGLLSDGEVRLRRVLSHVTVNFNAGTDAKGNAVKKLSLLKYEIHNVPKGGALFEDGRDTDAAMQDISYSQLSTQTPNQIFSYLPENIQSAPMGAVINSQKDREKNSYAADGTKSFPNAPSWSTYIVATVELETTDFVGELEYTIHLGNFSESLNDFNTLRNCRYTYDVTVNDANEFVTDVKTDDDGRAEGIIFDKNSSNVYTVDSHYGIVLSQFTAGEIKKAMAASRQATGVEGLMFQLRTWRGSTGECVIDKDGNIYKDGSKIATVTDDMGSILGVDCQWLEFVEASSGSRYDASDTFDGGNPDLWSEYVTKIGAWGYYSINGSRTVYSFPQFVSKLCSWASWASDADVSTFDCYIRENYYYEPGVTWDMFVNTDPRTAYILSSVEASADGRSMYGRLSFGVSQYSIQTAYALDKSGQIIAIGLESVDETAGKYDYSNGDNFMACTSDNDGKDARYIFGINSVAGSYDGMTLDNDGNFSQMAYGKYRTYWKVIEEANQMINNGDYTTINPIKACAIRNREFRIPGSLKPPKDESSEWMGWAEPWEMGWYLPSLEQYIGFWIGEEGLRKDSKFYQNQTSSLGNSYSSGKYLPGMMHYWTYTKGSEVFWSEEGAAFGQYGGLGDVKYVRCARLLQSYGVKDENGKGNSHGWGLDRDLVPADYYSFDSATSTVSLDNLSQDALRTVYQENELVSHNEREDGNKSAVKFQIADSYVGAKGIVTTPSWAGLKTTGTTLQDVLDKKTQCQGVYSQGGDAAGWRVPNQREMALVSILKKAGKVSFPAMTDGSGQFGYFALTSFSNPAYRAGYGIEQTNYRMYPPTSTEDTYGWIRCVRDRR